MTIDRSFNKIGSITVLPFFQVLELAPGGSITILTVLPFLSEIGIHRKNHI